MKLSSGNALCVRCHCLGILHLLGDKITLYPSKRQSYCWVTPLRSKHVEKELYIKRCRLAISAW